MTDRGTAVTAQAVSGMRVAVHSTEVHMSDAFREIDETSSWCDNQYVLALAIARRVRKLKSGAPPLIDHTDPKHRPFETAMAEIARGRITYDTKNKV